MLLKYLLKRIGKNEVEWASKAVNCKAAFLAVGEAWTAIFWLHDLKERAFDRSGIPAEKDLIFSNRNKSKS